MVEKTSYDHLILANPQDGQAYYERGIFFLEEREDFEQAKEDFIQAINCEYAVADSYSNLALIYDMQDNSEAALTCLNKAVEIDPEHSVSWFALGTLHSIYGRHEEALNALAQVLTIELDYQEDGEFLEEDFSFAMEAFALRARIYLEQNENLLALAECQASRSFDPDTNECELLEIVALIRLNQTKEAKKILADILHDEDIQIESLKEHPLFCELKKFL